MENLINRNTFCKDYHHLIEDRIKFLDNSQHSKTTHNRHYNRLRNKVIDDMLKEHNQGSIMKIELNQYTKNLVRLDATPKSNFWAGKLEQYDLEDKCLGSSKESRLLEKKFT